MDVTDMGRVAAASTNIDNGFEHYWREVVRASRDYEVALDDRHEAEEELEGVSEGGIDAFQEALNSLPGCQYWRLESVDFEDETRLIHFRWSWRVS